MGPARVAGVTLLVFGVMFVFIGLILLGLCLPMGGLLCQDTGIGTIGTALFAIGAIPFILGVVLMRVGRKSDAAKLAAQPAASLVDQVAADERRAALQMRESSPAAAEPVALKCPDCGAPITAGAKVCEFCGQTFA